MNRLSTNFIPYDILPTVLRCTLGLVFILGGTKIGFPPDPEALAASYIDPQTGWIHPVVADFITVQLGMSIASFLQIQGLVEILIGALLILGIFTTPVALIMGFMFWSFAVANPVLGEIRLSRDIALAGICVALAIAGPGRWSLDVQLRKVKAWFEERRDIVLVIIRLSLAFTLIASTLVTVDPFVNPLNSTLPIFMVLGLGLLLAFGILPRWTAGALMAWMLFVVINSLMAKGLIAGLEGTKRELGIMIGSFTYFMAGADRWSPLTVYKMLLAQSDGQEKQMPPAKGSVETA